MKRTSLLILGVTAILLSRAMFAFFDDPEGPNLLVVIGMAVIIYFLSLAVYLFFPLNLPSTDIKKLLLMIFIQVVLVSGFYFLLR